MPRIKRPPCPTAATSEDPEKEQCTRRPRTVFSQRQLAVLMDAFEKNSLPECDVVQELASKLDLNEMVIKNWFKNQRMKQKKEQLKRQREASPGTSTQHFLEKPEAPLQTPITTASLIPGTSGDRNHDPQESSDSQTSMRDGTPMLGSPVNSQCDDIQNIHLGNLDTPWTCTPSDICELVGLYALPGEDDPNSLDIYLPTRRL